MKIIVNDSSAWVSCGCGVKLHIGCLTEQQGWWIFFQFVKANYHLIKFMLNGRFCGRFTTSLLPSKQAFTGLTNHDQHLHSTHRHNSEFNESLVTRAPHLRLLTGPRLGLGSHLAPCSCCSCQLLASQIQSDIFIAYFTHSLHKTTASPWCPSAFSP